MKTISLSLHKANKLRSEIVSRFSKLNIRQTFGIVNIRLSKNDLQEEVNQDIDKKISNSDNNEKLYIELLETEAKLKILIFNNNVKSGLSDVLEELSLVKSKIIIFERIEKNRENSKNRENVKIEENLNIIKESEDSYVTKDINVNTSFVPEDIPTLKKKKRELEDKCNEFNVLTKIDLEISDLIAETFGF